MLMIPMTIVLKNHKTYIYIFIIISLNQFLIKKNNRNIFFVVSSFNCLKLIIYYLRNFPFLQRNLNFPPYYSFLNIF